MDILGPALGSVVSGLFGQSSAKKSMKFQREAAQNAHQWEVQDLQKAGLNPILSAGGSGAKPSGGAQATMPDLGQAVTTGKQAALLSAQIEKVKSEHGTVLQNQNINLPLEMAALETARQARSLKTNAKQAGKAGGAQAYKFIDSAKSMGRKLSEASFPPTYKPKNHPSGSPKNRKAVHPSFKPHGSKLR